MRDVDQHPEEESPYECFDCGTIIAAVTSPGACPDCGGEVRNRETPIE
jgi:rubrerythrin